MSKLTPVQEVHDMQSKRKKAALAAKTEPVRYTLSGLALLVEATAMAITSGFAIYSGWHGKDLATWSRDILFIAGAFIAVRAFWEFIRFLNRRG